VGSGFPTSPRLGGELFDQLVKLVCSDARIAVVTLDHLEVVPVCRQTKSGFAPVASRNEM
jgi:hypothetical protein